MDNARVTGVRSIELGVTNLDRAAAFYKHVWGLEPAAAENDSIHLRANSTEHHIVTLRGRPRPRCSACISRPRTAMPSTRSRQGQGVRCERDGRAGGAAGERRRRLRLSSARRKGTCSMSRRTWRSTRTWSRTFEADQALPCGPQQRQDRRADEIFIDLLGQIQRRDRHDGLHPRALTTTASHSRRRSTWKHGLRGREHRRVDAGRRTAQAQRFQRRVGRRPPRAGRQCVLLFRRAERLRCRIHRRGRAGR